MVKHHSNDGGASVQCDDHRFSTSSSTSTSDVISPTRKQTRSLVRKNKAMNAPITISEESNEYECTVEFSSRKRIRLSSALPEDSNNSTKPKTGSSSKSSQDQVTVTLEETHTESVSSSSPSHDELKQLRASVANLEQENRELKRKSRERSNSELEELQQEKDQLDCQNKDLQEKFNQSLKENEELKSRICAKDRFIQAKQQQLLDYVREKKKIQKQNKERPSSPTKGAYEKQLMDSLREKEILKEELVSRDRSIQVLQAQLRQSVQHQQHHVQHQTWAVSQLLSEKLDAEVQHDRLQAESRDQKKDLQHLYNENDTLRDQVKMEKRHAVDLIQERDKLLGTVKALQESISQLVNEKLDVEAKHLQLQVESNEQKKDLQRLNDENKTQQLQVTEWKKHAVCLNQEREKLQGTIQSLNAIIATSHLDPNNSIKEDPESPARNPSNIHHLQLEIERLKTQVGYFENISLGLFKDREKSQEMIDRLEQTIEANKSQVEEQLRSIQEEHKETVRKVEASLLSSPKKQQQQHHSESNQRLLTEEIAQLKQTIHQMKENQMGDVEHSREKIMNKKNQHHDDDEQKEK